MQTSKEFDIAIPGRICLFGEHSDWAGEFQMQNPEILSGQTIISGTDMAIHAKVHRSPNLQIHSVNDLGNTIAPQIIPMELEILKDVAQTGQFYRYVAGVAYQMFKHFPSIGGLFIDNYRTDLPMKKGLSSSAAICVLTARAFNLVYNLHLSIEEEMHFAFLGERTTPSQCGQMDQGCAYGNRPVLMTFQGETMRAAPLQAKVPLRLVIVDLGASKDTTKILLQLRSCYPIAQTEIQKGVQKLFGEINHRIIAQAKEAINRGDIAQIGKLMTEAQKEFDRYAQPACPEQLTSPVLHKLLADIEMKKLTLGGKGVGSQGDGSAQFIVQTAKDQEKVVSYIQKKYPTMHPFALTIPSN